MSDSSNRPTVRIALPESLLGPALNRELVADYVEGAIARGEGTLVASTSVPDTDAFQRFTLRGKGIAFFVVSSFYVQQSESQWLVIQVPPETLRQMRTP